MTAGTRPVTIAQPCAIDSARFSWVARTGRGAGAPVRAALAKASTKRREVGAGIGEQIFDPALGQEGQISLGDAVDRQFLARHPNPQALVVNGLP